MRLSRKILLGASAVVVLINVIVLSLVIWRYEVQYRNVLLESARSYYKLVVVVRAWVAEHDGVFLRERPGTEPNPYLEAPVLHAADGTTLVWRNPAMVTRELSELGARMGRPIAMRVTSLTPVNPGNTPDAFEREALEALERGDRMLLSELGEFMRFEDVGGRRSFRYFAPLYAEESCLSCHRQHGFQQGQVRGGVSITLPAEWQNGAASGSMLLMVLGSLLASAAISAVVFWLLRRSVLRPLRRIEDAALEIGKGNYDTEILTESADEIGDVGRAMMKMQRAVRLRLRNQVQREKMFALGQLSAGIAHEIRNPLFAIRNDLDYLQRTHPGDAQQTEVYREMEQGVQRISGIVNAVLGYARPHRPEYGRHRLEDVLGHCMALMGKQLETDGVRVTLDLAPDLPDIELDAHRIEQVFVNLLANAAAARRGSHGTIRIRAWAEGEQVIIRVQDDGEGIAADDLSRVFDPFFTRSSDGTGLGLTIVRRIIEQHHGSIEVESEPGRGTAFTLHLPVRQQQLEPA
jgi:two-component system, NtrC family, sensor kinase